MNTQNIFSKYSRADPGKPFFYQVGITTTTLIWTRPTFIKVQELFKDLWNTTDLFERYNIYLMGGVTWDFKTTWDVDIVLQSQDYQDTRIETDIHTVNDRALNSFKILTDTQWRKEPLTVVSYSDLVQNDYYLYQSDMIKPAYKVKMMNSQKAVMDRTEYKTTLSGGSIERVGELCILYRAHPRKVHQKIIDKLKNTVGEQGVFNFLAKDFMLYDEDYFNTIKNKFKKSNNL